MILWYLVATICMLTTSTGESGSESGSGGMDVEDESGSEDDGDSGLEDEMSEEEEGAGGKRKRGKVRSRGAVARRSGEGGEVVMKYCFAFLQCLLWQATFNKGGAKL